MTFLGARFPFFDKRRIFHLAGLIRQYRTKSYRAFCEADVEKLKKLTLYSVYLTYWCPPPGIPLSAIRMNVSKVSSSELRLQKVQTWSFRCAKRNPVRL